MIKKGSNNGARGIYNCRGNTELMLPVSVMDVLGRLSKSLREDREGSCPFSCAGKLVHSSCLRSTPVQNNRETRIGPMLKLIKLFIIILKFIFNASREVLTDGTSCAALLGVHRTQTQNSKDTLLRSEACCKQVNLPTKKIYETESPQRGITCWKLDSRANLQTSITDMSTVPGAGK